MKITKKSKFNKKSKMYQKRNWAPYHFLGTISNSFQNNANRNNALCHLVVERAPKTKYYTKNYNFVSSSWSSILSFRSSFHNEVIEDVVWFASRSFLKSDMVSNFVFGVFLVFCTFWFYFFIFCFYFF